MMKRLLLIAILFLAGCTSEDTVKRDAEMMFYDIVEVLEGLENRIIDLESDNDYLIWENQQLRDDIDQITSELEDADSRLFDIELYLKMK